MRWVRLVVTGNGIKYPLRYLMINLLGVICLLPAGIQPVWGDDKKTDFSIPRSSADHALNLFAQQADIQLMYPYDAIKSIKVRGLLGRYTVDDGVQRLLRGTCLKAEFRPDYGHPNQVNNKKGIIMVLVMLPAGILINA